MGMELDLHAYTSLVWGFSHCGQVPRAKSLLYEMLGKGIIPDQVLCIYLLRKYYELGDINEAQELHNDMMMRGLVAGTMDITVTSVHT
ncbi:Tetratricopeptide-like helical domain superfamily [Sesbania bispinosa]|nr:Tetratricopeptide-like helical domain superfamily [Sesbania bispinosa]